MEKHGLINKDVKGRILLFKNDKLIRDKTFNSKWYRENIMKEFMAICKIDTDDSYYITITLNI